MQTIHSNDLIRNQARAPFVIYADFETINLSAEEQAAAGRKSHKYQKQVPCAVGYKIVAHPGIPMNFEYKAAVGPDCHKWFIREMLERETQLMEILDRDMTINMDYDAWRKFNEATECYLCHKPFDREKPEDKVYRRVINIYLTKCTSIIPDVVLLAHMWHLICRSEIMIT